MPFTLKNDGAIYQELVNKMFTDQTGKKMKVYIDDMLVLTDTFDTIQKYQMKLNLPKYAFKVESRKFLSFMANQQR